MHRHPITTMDLSLVGRAFCNRASGSIYKVVAEDGETISVCRTIDGPSCILCLHRDRILGNPLFHEVK